MSIKSINYSSLDDSSLVQGFTKSNGGRRLYFREIITRYEPLVYKLCLRYFKSQESAEDLTQETFIRVYNKLNKIEDPKKLKSWILTLAGNLCRDTYRTQQKRLKLKEDIRKELNINEAQDNLLNQNLRNKELLTSIKKLKPVDQKIIERHYFMDLTLREIAVDLSMTESAVKMRLTRARDSLEIDLTK